MKSQIILLVLMRLISISSDTYSQDTIKGTLNFSVRYSYNYNFKVAHHTPVYAKVAHHTPVFAIEVNNHNLYFGPEYTHVFQPTPIASIIYKKHAAGFNFGYRYYFNEQEKKLRFFSQLNFSIFQIKYKQYSKFAPFEKDMKKLIIENTGSLGADYNFYKNFHAFTGIGIGSWNQFFLILTNSFPSSYIGIEYKF